jgi:branched-chain amino acid transport system permease protein
MRKGGIRKFILFSGLGLAILFPILIRDDFILHLSIFSGIAVLLALSQDVITGVAGQISVAQAAFYGVGAYTSAILSLRLGLSFWLTAPLAIVFTGLLSLLLGVISFRLKGIFLAVTTLAFGELVFLVLLNWTDITGGPMGLTDIPRPQSLSVAGLNILSFETKTGYCYLIITLDILVMWAVLNLVNSRWGRALRAIKQNELVAQAMGINANRYKLYAFMLSSGIAGLAGSNYAHYVLYVSPDTFVFSYAVTILSMAVIGGLGTIWGPILGAIIVTILPEYLRVIRDYRLIIFGGIVLLMMARFPQGLLPGLKALMAKTDFWHRG